MQPQTVRIAMPDGTANALLAHPPQAERGPGVLFFMDAIGLRPALADMVARIAAEGYTVLAPDVFYRSQPYGPFDTRTLFGDKEQLRALGRMNRAFANPHDHSPHHLAGRIKGRIYIGVAETDAFFEAEEEGRLMAALRGGGVNHILETYPGTHHGFAVPDLPVHQPEAAEEHYQRLFRVFASC